MTTETHELIIKVSNPFSDLARCYETVKELRQKNDALVDQVSGFLVFESKVFGSKSGNGIALKPPDEMEKFLPI